VIRNAVLDAWRVYHLSGDKGEGLKNKDYFPNKGELVKNILRDSGASKPI
jgi:hypothetical protein